MSTFKTLTTITDRKLKVRPNHSKKHFTIITDSGKWRTNTLPMQEFESCLYNTGDDWQNFLKSDDYYPVKK